MNYILTNFFIYILTVLKMRKFNFIFGVLAVASAGLMTSCDWSDDDDKDLAPNVSVPSLDGKTLVVNTNVDKASIKLNNDTPKSGKSATFAVSGNTATVTVSAAGYSTQTVEVVLGENSMLSVDVNLVKASSITKTQEEAKGSSVSNDSENVRTSGVNASIAVPQDAEIRGTGDFSIVAYVPAGADRSDLKNNDNVELPVLALECKPDGANFPTTPVTLTASIIGANGCDVVCKNGDDEITATTNDNSVSAEVSHFSVWSFVLKAQVVTVNDEEETKKGSILLANGNNTINYTQKYGYEVVSGVSGSLITNFLVNKFGKAGSVKKSVNITSDKVGSADYTVKQAVKTYTFKSGTKEFRVKVYGALTVTIDRTTSDTSGHSGGGGK